MYLLQDTKWKKKNSLSALRFELRKSSKSITQPEHEPNHQIEENTLVRS